MSPPTESLNPSIADRDLRRNQQPGGIVPGRIWRRTKLAVALLLLMLIGVTGFLYLFPEQAARLALDLGRWRAGLSRKELVLPDGLPRYILREVVARRSYFCTDSERTRISSQLSRGF